MNRKWYVGHNPKALTAFTADFEPTRETHGSIYSAVIGPFRTKRAALWAEQYGMGNPHFRHVEDAERHSRIA